MRLGIEVQEEYTICLEAHRATGSLVFSFSVAVWPLTKDECCGEGHRSGEKGQGRTLQRQGPTWPVDTSPAVSVKRWVRQF